VPAVLGRWLLAFVVVTALLHSGARYFYCDALGLRATDPCAHAAREQRSPTEAVDQDFGDCCEVLTLSAVPNGVAVESPAVPPAVHVATLAAADWLARTGASTASRSRGDASERWRPPPRGPTEGRARLMVFLT
jgi:hypothetical protein